METVVFGAGCFWGVQSSFDALPGVLSTRVGYAGGTVDAPTYELVCSGKTGHAEVVEVIFDPAIITFTALVHHFFALHDPTQLNRQGPDIGTQYRSVIFVTSDEQNTTARAIKADELSRRSIVTKIEPAPTFWPAEEYHQKYLARRGQGACAI